MSEKIADTRVANSRKKSAKVATPTTTGMQRTEGMPSNWLFFAYYNFFAKNNYFRGNKKSLVDFRKTFAQIKMLSKMKWHFRLNFYKTIEISFLWFGITLRAMRYAIVIVYTIFLFRSAYDLGIRYIGGCCGFEPYHIRLKIIYLNITNAYLLHILSFD